MAPRTSPVSPALHAAASYTRTRYLVCSEVYGYRQVLVIPTGSKCEHTHFINEKPEAERARSPSTTATQLGCSTGPFKVRDRSVSYTCLNSRLSPPEKNLKTTHARRRLTFQALEYSTGEPGRDSGALERFMDQPEFREVMSTYRQRGGLCLV